MIIKAFSEYLQNIEIEERGYEVGVYDCDTNIFYYYLSRD